MAARSVWGTMLTASSGSPLSRAAPAQLRRERQVRMDRLGAAAQDHGVAGLHAQGGRVDGDVGSRLVDDADRRRAGCACDPRGARWDAPRCASPRRPGRPGPRPRAAPRACPRSAPRRARGASRAAPSAPWRPLPRGPCGSRRGCPPAPPRCARPRAAARRSSARSRAPPACATPLAHAARAGRSLVRAGDRRSCRGLSGARRGAIEDDEVVAMDHLVAVRIS